MSVKMKSSHHILTADQSRLSRTDMETKMEDFSPRRQETGDRRQLRRRQEKAALCAPYITSSG